MNQKDYEINFLNSTVTYKSVAKFVIRPQLFAHIADQGNINRYVLGHKKLDFWCHNK